MLSDPQILDPANKVCSGLVKSPHHSVLKKIFGKTTKLLNIKFYCPNAREWVNRSTYKHTHTYTNAHTCIHIHIHTLSTHTHMCTNPFFVSAIIDTDWHMFICLQVKRTEVTRWQEPTFMTLLFSSINISNFWSLYRKSLGSQQMPDNASLLCGNHVGRAFHIWPKCICLPNTTVRHEILAPIKDLGATPASAPPHPSLAST